MIIENNIKSKIKSELIDAKSFWIATAMISNNGWNFIQKNISKNTAQHFLIGIDLANFILSLQTYKKQHKVKSTTYKKNYKVKSSTCKK